MATFGDSIDDFRSQSFQQFGASSNIVQLSNLADFSSHVNSSVPLDTPIFLASPSEICFQNYEPFAVYECVISLRNMDTVSRQVKLEPPKSHYFNLRKSAKSSRIAPGMDAKFTLEFRPQAKIDYNCDLVCSTERESFLIPVRAEGSRPAVDLAADYDFGVVPVNHTSILPILVRNTGSLATNFVVSTSSNLFGVQPSGGILNVGEAVQLVLSVTPNVRLILLIFIVCFL
jgi:hydrocephalus-inducing protein